MKLGYGPGVGMPRRKSRRLEIDGETFLWRMDRKTRYRGDAPLATRVTVQRDDPRPGRVAQFVLRSKRIREDCDEGDYQHRATLGPGDVRRLVLYALERGWNPAVSGPAFKVDPDTASPALGHYEVVEHRR